MNLSSQSAFSPLSSDVPYFRHERCEGRRRIHKYFLRLKSFRYEIWVRDMGAQPFLALMELVFNTRGAGGRERVFSKN